MDADTIAIPIVNAYKKTGATNIVTDPDKNAITNENSRNDNTTADSGEFKNTFAG